MCLPIAALSFRIVCVGPLLCTACSLSPGLCLLVGFTLVTVLGESSLDACWFPEFMLG